MNRTRDELDASNVRLRRLERELDSLTEQLEATRTADTTVLPAQNPERLISGGVLNRTDGFWALVDAGHLAPDDVESALDGSTQPLRESRQDRRETYTTRSLLALLGSYESHESLEDIEEWAVRPSVPFAGFESVDRVDAETPVLLTALAIHTPIALENTSEFGTLHEHYTDPDRNLSSQFSGEVTDEMVTERFAYPKLVEKSTRNLVGLSLSENFERLLQTEPCLVCRRRLLTGVARVDSSLLDNASVGALPPSSCGESSRAIVHTG